MNVLGVIFDSKLDWSINVANTINKAKITCHEIKLVKPYIANTELRQLITSNFYLRLYYYSEIWQLPTLNAYSKRQLLSASSLALKLFI